MNSKERREEREYLAQVDRTLEHWQATSADHKADQKRRHAVYLASGEYDREQARGQAIIDQTWAFERARIAK